MRSVFVFPTGDLERVQRLLTRLAREESDGRWSIDAARPSDSPAISVWIETTADDVAPLYCDWEPDQVERLRADYNDHCWTAAEIADDRVVDGLRFFDYRTSYEQSRGPRQDL